MSRYLAAYTVLSVPGIEVRGWVTHKDDLEKHLLVHLHEFLVPLIDVGSLLTRIGVVIVGSDRVGLVVVAPLNDLTENSIVDL